MKNPIKHSLLTCGLCLALPFASAQAANQTGAGQLSADNAINQLKGSLASAELTLSLVAAEEAIRGGQAQTAINHLTASLASAGVVMSMAEASEAVRQVGDQQLLNELDVLLKGQDMEQAAGLMAAVVAERPELAAHVQTLGLDAGYDEAMVATSIFTGLGDAPATAAGTAVK